LTGEHVDATFLLVLRYGRILVRRAAGHYVKPSTAYRGGLTSRRGVLVLLSIALVLAGVYFCLPGSVLSSFPFACQIPEAPALAASYSSPSMTEETMPADPALPNGSQEISELTGQGDTLLSLLNANLDDADEARKISSSLTSVIRPALDKPFGPHAVLQSGRRYSLTVDAQGRFLKMSIELDPANVFHCVRENGALRSWKEEVVLDYQAETITFALRGSLHESIINAGEGTELALKLLNVFRWDIDFQSESMSGDICKVLFERRYADDRPSGYGDILCAVYDGKKTGRKVAVLFNRAYYDENGVDLKKNFLRSPLSELRVTSKYGMRFHPIKKVWRKHNGVDYGAPVGTPVWAVASGVVTFAGWQRGYGRYVCIRHDNGYESRYGHLHRYFVAKGQRVKQRQRIGLVGQSGEATGPHLDFQLLRANRHVDPQDRSVRMVSTLRSVPGPLKPRFETVAQQRLLHLQGIALGRPARGSKTSSLD